MQKLKKYLGFLEEFIVALFFISGSIVSLYGVFMRYIVNSPVTWTTEIFETLMVFAIFIGFGIALKDNHHISVDLLYEKLPDFAKKIMNLVANILGLSFGILMTKMGYEMVKVAHSQGTITIDVGIPVWITYLAMPLGMGLLTFYFLVRLIKHIITWNEPEETEELDIEELY